MHLRRWLTAIIAVPVLIFLVGFGPRWILYLLFYLVSLVGLYEFYGLVSPGLPKVIQGAGYLLIFLLFLIMYRGQLLYALAVISFLTILPMTFYLFIPPSTGRDRTSELGKAVMGPVYVGLPLAMLLPIDRYYLIHYHTQGIWIFFLLAVTFANDTGAFYFGKIFGKHRLYESVSPKKTWEGAAGGLISGLIAGLLFIFLLRPYPVNPVAVGLILALCISGQIGDLSESMLKREHGAKDSGGILPGHGGILDRIDSILFSVPILYLFLLWSIPG